MIYHHLILTLLCIFALSSLAHAQEGEPFERRVLGIYNSAEGKTLNYNPLRESVEMVLHNIGLQLEYHDIVDGLPPESQMQRYRGAIIWLETDRLSAAADYWTWLQMQLKNNKRIVLLNSLSPFRDADSGQRISMSRINSALSLLGLRAGESYTSLPLDIEVLDKVPAMVEFERQLENEVRFFTEVQSINEANEVYLQLRMKSTGAHSDAVVITPNGGLVTEGYLQYIDITTRKKQWRLDPFAFFSKALGVDDAPRLDCTTLNGNRIYYSHIDGDGLLNLSRVDRKSPSARIIYEGILKTYPSLPFTCSVIIHDVDERLAGNPAATELARRIFQLPQVEAASHTYSHPLVWNLELEQEDTVEEYLATIAGAQLTDRAILPWDIPGYSFDPQMETAESCRFIEENLLPPNKHCRLLLWSGNCLPDEETLAACTDAGLTNINGGDSRFDGDFPSYNYVAPLYRKVGEQYQIHSSNSNENNYTELWSGPFGGFQNVIQTFENTETPRRVLPVNIYYHYYSGERVASLRALEKVYAWVAEHQREFFPLFTSEYVDVVRGFIAARISKLGLRHWRIADSGDCRTVRFDACALYPDLERSTGIIGFRHYQNSLYIALDEAETHEIFLVEAAPVQFYLDRASAPVLDLAWRENGAFSFRSQALGTAHFSWANAPADASFTVQVTSDEDRRTFRARSDAEGRLQCSLPLNGPVSIAFSVDATDQL